MIFIVTGSTSGLGLELAKRLTKIGSVKGISRGTSVPKVLRSKGLLYEHYSIDLSDDAVVVRDKYSKLLARLPQDEDITLIINAAQFASSEAVMDPEETLALYNCNFFNSTVLVKATMRQKLRRVLFVNSISGLVAQPEQFDYSASKHALQAYANVLSISAKEKNFDVMTVNPGGINTPLWDNISLRHNVAQFLDPSELSEILIMLLTLKGRYFIKNMAILPPVDL